MAIISYISTLLKGRFGGFEKEYFFKKQRHDRGLELAKS